MLAGYNQETLNSFLYKQDYLKENWAKVWGEYA